MLRHQNMAGIAAIHNALRNIDSGAGNVSLLIKIGDFVNRTAVDAHAHGKLWMAPQCFGNLDRA